MSTQTVQVQILHKTVRFDFQQRRILSEEYGPKIIYIKGIHNTVADSISRLDYDPKEESPNEHNHAMQNVFTKDKTRQKWLMF
jgi:hypothetical protein